MNYKNNINLVITDLDDTIWDWLNMWYNSFYPYFTSIKTQFSLDDDILKSEFKRIHQKYGTTEASFVFQDLSCLNEDQKASIDLSKDSQKSILHEYYSNKKKNLQLFPNVLETLQQIKDGGALIIGFTESNSFFTKYRIKHLNIDGLIDYIYAPVDSGVPKNVYKYYSDDFWEPEITEFRYLSKDVKKPAPEILDIILKDFKAKKENTIYIGDKLDKDISMANEAGVTSVYAKYGHLIDSSKYHLLKEVTHWTEADVQREIRYKQNHNLNNIATYTLESSLSELTKYFRFCEFNIKTSHKNLSGVITAWEKAIEVQQHFNEIELKIRSLALTAFTFIIGGIGYSEKENLLFNWNDFIIPYSSVLAFLGIILITAFYYMDKFWYHRLLKGAVNHATSIERKWCKIIPEIGLSSAIGKASPHYLYEKEGKQPKWKIGSNEKYRIFYGLIFLTLIAIGSVLVITNNWTLIRNYFDNLLSMH